MPEPLHNWTPLICIHWRRRIKSCFQAFKNQLLFSQVTQLVFEQVSCLASRLLKKDTECFESLSMNGIFVIISNSLSVRPEPVEGLREIFQQPARDQLLDP